jgi:hypothetical protein
MIGEDIEVAQELKKESVRTTLSNDKEMMTIYMNQPANLEPPLDFWPVLFN